MIRLRASAARLAEGTVFCKPFKHLSEILCIWRRRTEWSAGISTRQRNRQINFQDLGSLSLGRNSKLEVHARGLLGGSIHHLQQLLYQLLMYGSNLSLKCSCLWSHNGEYIYLCSTLYMFP